MRKLFKILGPGLLYAGAAVGVSHLVQSTRAGAMFNFDLIWILILANILKYPFFEFGPRYAIATQNSIIDGYNQIGKWAVAIFGVVSFISMFIFQAAVIAVTVGLISFVFNITINLVVLSIIVMLISAVILIFGKYEILDKIIKYVILLLTLSTVIAVFSALDIDKVVTPEALKNFTWSREADVFFMIAFVGWMPAPIDVSVWSSVWNLAKAREIGYFPSMKDALTEFRVGYIGTAILALCFLLLGALVMYGTGEEFSPSGTVFSEQLILMYTTSLGSWAYWIVSIAAVATMISTTITVLDAYPRVLTPTLKHLFPKSLNRSGISHTLYIILLVVFVIGTVLLLIYGTSSMGAMVGFATTLSFLVAPILAWLNYRAVTDKHFPESARPGLFLRILSWAGIILFAGFSVVFVVMKFI